jgi:putative mRNA 3-end processing factor
MNNRGVPVHPAGTPSFSAIGLGVDDLLVADGRGLTCPQGGFHIDPWRPVPLAVITHAHGDHARPGSGSYIAAAPGVEILRRRLGLTAGNLRAVPYGEQVRLGSVTVSLHPAGHILGSAQVRIESAGGGGSVWVASGDYKRQSDPTCDPFEIVPCDVFVTESTFALPIYCWRSSDVVAAEIHHWWSRNTDEGRASVLFCYALGKAQRLLAELARFTDRTVYTHGAIEPLVQAYRDAGIPMLPTRRIGEAESPAGNRAMRTMPAQFAGELILAPPSAGGSPWMRRFGAGRQFETGFASGWMRVRGIRRRRGYDRGFVLSDHADWDGLVRTVQETGAKRVIATHGSSDVLTRYLREQGLQADVLSTPYTAEGEEE